MPRLLRLPATVAATLIGLLLAAPAASAHGLVGRSDLPVPEWLFAWAAAAVLIVSFVTLGSLWRTAWLGSVKEHRIARVPSWLAIPGGLLGIALLVLTIVAGIGGAQIDITNFAPTSIFVLLWVGVPFASLLVGDLWQWVNPLRAGGRATGWLLGRIAGPRMPPPLDYPERFGRWPAAAGLVGFGWLELAWPNRQSPADLALVALAYCVVMGIGMSLYGADRWLQRVDPFTAWFGWIATLAPLRWEGGTLYLRPPIVGLARARAGIGDPAVVIAAIGTTTWDGLSGGSLLGPRLGDFANDLSGFGLGDTWTLALVDTLGLLTVLAVVGFAIWIGVRAMRPGATRGDTALMMRAFTPALVPIAAAYLVGHYLSLLAFQGQALPSMLANPFGHELMPGDGGWLGTAQWEINYTWLSYNAIWYLQVAALLVGHVAALVLAHDRAIERFSPKRAARSQRAMLVVAVGFTCTGLFLLSAVN